MHNNIPQDKTPQDKTPHDTTPRQLIICCDGTNNNLTGGQQDTNVVRLCELLARRGAADQIVFYDPGVGNPGELPGATYWERIRRLSDRLAGLALGQGIYENMVECYQFLMQHYRPGDQIYLFGFSRGAFTARSVAGLVNMFGILQPHMVSMVPTLLHVYFSDRDVSGERMKKITAQLTHLFADPMERRVDIHFIGVWDTVASVGLPPFSKGFTARANVDGKRFIHVRHALALDEYRTQFAPRQYVNPNGEYASDSGKPVTLKQMWFRGAHTDVGGGRTPDGMALADVAMGWLVSEATACGLQLGQAEGASLSDKEVLQLVYPQVDGQAARPAKPVVSSQLHATPIWAVTGMKVRTPGLVDDGSGGTLTIPAEEHPSVAQRVAHQSAHQGAHPLAYPQDTVWAKPLAWLPLLLWGLVFLVLYGALGELLAPSAGRPVEGALSDAWAAIQRYPDYVMRNIQFVCWQLSWWLPGLTDSGAVWRGLIKGLGQYTEFRSPRWALLWDFGLILAYAQVLSRLCVAGFARGAQLRRVGQAAPVWLNRAGWALPLMVLSDVFENISSWLAITFTETNYLWLAAGSGVLMTCFALLKWLALLGVIALIFWPRGKKT
jgi:uncharacterized protein (DUF2235 family)